MCVTTVHLSYLVNANADVSYMTQLELNSNVTYEEETKCG